MASGINQPLAERVRPEKLSEVIGQEQVTGPGKLLAEMVRTNSPVSLILWGPPGSGKTTLARVFAHELKAEFTEMSAVMAGVADIRKVIELAQMNKRFGKPTIVFIDEIHRFNKAQQDSLLPHVESGLITLVGATTENPSFSVISPLLSRSRVVVLNQLSDEAVREIVLRALTKIGRGEDALAPGALEFLVHAAGGDARVALGTLDVAMLFSDGGPLTETELETALGRKVGRHDRKGESHYNLASAFIKSLRGSDESAALYYLARFLKMGEDPLFIARRMVIFASEDIGLADKYATLLAESVLEETKNVGMPECQYALFHAALYLVRAKKDRTVADAMSSALKKAEETPDLQVPLHIRNAVTDLMKELEYGKGYKWKAGFKHEKGFLPEEIEDWKVLDEE
ncbi:MAG: replication-associated recombination protein A [Patescibacteria group bacterium]|nr:replication-associated recombination protein A [Patescibacteria group bacterium]